MKIAIVSDTHGNAANFKKVVKWLNENNINLILHCGDIGSPEFLKESLADFEGDFLGVLGNMDKDYRILLEEYNKIPRVKIQEDILETKIPSARASSEPQPNSSGQVKIAITHKPEKAKELAETGKYDLVFYGHTHRPWEEKVGDCRMINPGELAGQFYKPSFAVYDTDADKLELKILERL